MVVSGSQQTIRSIKHKREQAATNQLRANRHSLSNSLKIYFMEP